MKLKKLVIMSFLFVPSLIFSALKIEIIKHNDALVTVDSVTIKVNETKVQYVDKLRLESSLNEAQNIVLNLFYKEDNGNYTPLYLSMPLQVKDGDEIAFVSEGFNLVLKVSLIE